LDLASIELWQLNITPIIHYIPWKAANRQSQAISQQGERIKIYLNYPTSEKMARQPWIFPAFPSAGHRGA
jgi:hypothetical protein